MRWLTLSAIVLAIASVFSVSAQKPPLEPSVPHAAGELLVTFRPSTDAPRRAMLAEAVGGRILRHFAHVGVTHLSVGRMDLARASALLLATGEVEAVQPNFLRYITALPPPNDPHWLNDDLWGLERIGIQNVWNTFNTGTSSVVVAHFDTGINYNHPDLVANVWVNPGETGLDAQGHDKCCNGIDDDGNGYIDDVHGINTINNTGNPWDDHGHGSWTAGITGAVGNNGLGVVGVNWNTKILSCKFLDSTGSGTDANATACFDYVIMMKQQYGINIRVANNSWGHVRDPNPANFPTALKSALDAAGNAGILSVAAAGNNGTNNDTTPFDPASFTQPPSSLGLPPSTTLLAVAASDSSDNRPSFSDYGATSVHLAAPGVNILNTWLGTGYQYLSGTSGATPHVSGTAALLLGQNNSLTVAQLMSAILNNVDVLPQWSGLTVTGGRLNTYQALVNGSFNVSPTVTLTNPTNGATFTASATITITADAHDSDGSVARVDFYANGSLIGSAIASPFTFTWTKVAAGTYTLTAVATDNKGAPKTSAPVSVTVNPDPNRVDVAAAAAGASATASSTYSSGFPPYSAIDGDHKGLNWGAGGGWNDGTVNVYPDWLEVDFAGAQTVNEIDVYTVQDNFANSVDPTSTMTFNLYGITDFTVQYWTGSQWLAVPNGTIAGNNLVWRSITFPALSTTQIRVVVTNALAGYSRIVEVEAYGPPTTSPPTVTMTSPTSGSIYTAPASIPLAATATATAPGATISQVAFYANGSLLTTLTQAPYSTTWNKVAVGTYSIVAVATDSNAVSTTSAPVSATVNPNPNRVDVAAAAAGATAVASSTYSGLPASGAIDGDHKNWAIGEGWNDGTVNVYPDWLEVDFAGAQTINEIDVYTVQDNYTNPVDPTSTMTFTQYGITDFTVQYWTGSQWLAVPNGSIAGNNLVWRSITFSALFTTQIRVLVTNALAGYSRIVEVEAYGPTTSSPTVTMTSPTSGSIYTAPASIPLAATATATAPGATISQVAFYANGSWLTTLTKSPYSTTWSNVAVGTYSITAVATDSNTVNTTSAPVSATVNGSPPVAPTSLTASAANTYQITLSWAEAAGQNQTGFNIYRCQGSGCSSFSKIASVGGSTLNYTDGSSSTPLTETTAYRYEVTAVNAAGESGPSNTYSATTLTEPAPTSLTSTAGQTRHGGKTQDFVNVTWANSSNDADGNHIERCTGSGCTGFSEIAIASATATTYTDNSVARTTTYQYRVRAHSPGGYSTYSNTTTVTTP